MAREAFAVDLVMFVCLLIGALVESDYKWGFYVFSLVR